MTRYDHAHRLTASPWLDRAGLRGKDQIIAQMADDLRVMNATRGCVTETDLTVIGWTTTQIVLHGQAATQLAYRQAAA